MRALAVVALTAAVLAGATSAACVRPTGNIYMPGSSCPEFAACDATFCSCAGAASGNTNASTCLASASSATCTTVQPCMSAYQTCLERIARFAGNSSSPCFMAASTIQVATLAAGTAFAGSVLQASCRYRTCVVLNASALGTCDFGTDDANVCMMPPAQTTTAAPDAGTPTTTAVPFVVAIRAVITIDGSAFASLLANNRAALIAAVIGDLATLLGVAAATIRIQSLVIGSLVVTFEVSADAGVQPSTLDTRLQAATTSNAWLSGTQNIYSTVSNETLAVTTAPNVLLTAAPGTVTDAPTTTEAPGGGSTGSPSAALGSVAVFAAAAVALLAAAL